MFFLIQFMDGMTMKDVLIVSNEFLTRNTAMVNGSNGPLPKLALYCLNKHLRDSDGDNLNLDKGDVSC